MRQIEVLDTTLRDGEQSPGCSMNIDEKLRIALQLERLNVDYIEAGFPVASPDDFAAVKAISKKVKNCGIAVLCRATAGDISCGWEAVKEAVNPRLHLVLAVSDLHIQYKLKTTHQRVMDDAVAMMRFAKKHCSNVQFSPEDATRANREYLLKVIDLVAAEGATIINITDTVGYLTHCEIAELVRQVGVVIGERKTKIGIHCHNDLGMAVANTLAGVEGGATQVECAIGGIGERAGNASLEEVVMALKTREDYYKCSTRINTRELYQANKLLFNIIGREIPPNKAIVGANAFTHESGIHQHGVLNNPATYEIILPEDVGIKTNTLVLGKHSGKAAVKNHLAEMGYNVEGKDLEEVLVGVKRLADRKKYLSGRDLEELVHKSAIKKQEYALSSFVVNSGSGISATAVVKLMKDGKEYVQVKVGESPVIAAFNAVDKIIRHSYPLHHFTIQSISEGRSALGEVLVQIQDGERFITGRAMATDIVEASIRAYLNAINNALSTTLGASGLK